MGEAGVMRGEEFNEFGGGKRVVNEACGYEKGEDLVEMRFSIAIG